MEKREVGEGLGKNELKRIVFLTCDQRNRLVQKGLLKSHNDTQASIDWFIECEWMSWIVDWLLDLLV